MTKIDQKWLNLFKKLLVILFLILSLILILFFANLQFAPKVRVTDLTYTEDFTSTIYQDASNTTGYWDTVLGQARLWGKLWTNMAGTATGSENLSNNAGDSYESQIQLDTNNNPYVVWGNYTIGNSGIFFTKWTPGTGWTKMDGTPGSENLSNNDEECYEPQIQLDTNNNPYVVWEDDATGNGDIYFTKWTPGIGWTNMAGTATGSENLSNNDLNSFSPQIQLDTNNNPYVVWEDGTEERVVWEEDTPGNNIFFTKWTPGIGWTKMDGTPGSENISNTARDSSSPQIQLDANNNPYVVWYDGFPGNNDIFFTKWTPGIGWTKMNGTPGYDNLSNNAGNSISPQIQLDANNNPYVVWHVVWEEDTPDNEDDTSVNYDIFFTKWTPGIGWTNMAGTATGSENLSNNTGNISNNIGESSGPQIQLDTNNNPYVVWGNYTIGNSGIFFTKWTPGIGWTKMDGTPGSENISNNTGYSYGPQIQLDANNNPYVVWHDGIPGKYKYDIFFIKWRPYNATSTIQSLNVNSGSEYVVSATLNATEILNGQTINYYLSNDGGTTWEAVTNGTPHTFTTIGNDLRWKAVLSTTNSNVTPIIDELSISYKTSPTPPTTPTP